jgi:uncharacterized protein (TIGR03790 family)
VAGIACGQKSANVLVLVNKSSPLSERIGEYYARVRAIPPGNICQIETTADETISREVYQLQIAAPAAACLKSKNLVERILYIVTTAGVPLRVAGSSSGMESDAASVDSELTLLYEAVRGKRAPPGGPVRNPFFSRRDEPFRHPQFPIYLVTRLAAYDFEEIRGMIDRCGSAVNRGNFVIDLNSADDRTGNDWLRTAALLLPRHRVVLDESPQVLYDQGDVIGYAAWGSNDPNRKRRKLGFRWLPGAIVSEYVSTNARTFARPPAAWNIGVWKDKAAFFAGSPQTLSADYIEEGATGASGHVFEPFLGFTPRPDYLLPAWLAGRNLAESYWLSIPALSWQNVVLGDPLCRLREP